MNSLWEHFRESDSGTVEYSAIHNDSAARSGFWTPTFHKMSASGGHETQDRVLKMLIEGKSQREFSLGTGETAGALNDGMSQS